MGAHSFLFGLAVGSLASYFLLRGQAWVKDKEVLSRVLFAADFAAKKHKDQRRKDPEATPYVNHPIGVALSLVEEGGVTDCRCLVSALLHDTVEDTDTTFEEIEKAFGSEVRHCVQELTDDKTLPAAERKLRAIQSAPTKSLAAKTVKMADLLYNLRDIQRVIPHEWDQHRALAYFDWAEKVYCGLRGTNSGLERELDQVIKQRLG
uniref:Guanosine-3',5'-bis(diphosphate) 3'-pyrophosphohydrolase MESH1 n=1 Tax=Compsopogon caeruleus TaxID=31354 RepID=A0A7S1XDG7_9RHOD|mmetsp:Transcript_14409/g.29478  ORF Transcript_14409/g.29478 Transcript_14409/m.29478 type:complete len:206 (+) Transcript_14409:146-763(+)